MVGRNMLGSGPLLTAHQKELLKVGRSDGVRINSHSRHSPSSSGQSPKARRGYRPLGGFVLRGCGKHPFLCSASSELKYVFISRKSYLVSSWPGVAICCFYFPLVNLRISVLHSEQKENRERKEFVCILTREF